MKQTSSVQNISASIMTRKTNLAGCITLLKCQKRAITTHLMKKINGMNLGIIAVFIGEQKRNERHG